MIEAVLASRFRPGTAHLGDAIHAPVPSETQRYEPAIMKKGNDFDRFVYFTDLGVAHDELP